MEFTYTVWDIGRPALHYVDKGLVQKSGFGGGGGVGAEHLKIRWLENT